MYRKSLKYLLNQSILSEILPNLSRFLYANLIYLRQRSQTRRSNHSLIITLKLNFGILILKLKFETQILNSVHELKVQTKFSLTQFSN